MVDPTVYLISGARGGIGLELIRQYAARANTFVYAGSLDPPTATALNKVASGFANVQVIQLRSESIEDHEKVAQEITRRFGKVDVVIANAGIFPVLATAATTSMEHFQRSFEVNTLGSIRLFQASDCLLKKSATPKFIYVSSWTGSITRHGDQWLASAYGASKAAMNFVMSRIHFENPDLIALCITPPATRTAQGLKSAERVELMKLKIELNLVPVEVATEGMVKMIDMAKRTEALQFLSETGESVPW